MTGVVVVSRGRFIIFQVGLACALTMLCSSASAQLSPDEAIPGQYLSKINYEAFQDFKQRNFPDSSDQEILDALYQAVGFTDSRKEISQLPDTALLHTESGQELDDDGILFAAAGLSTQIFEYIEPDFVVTKQTTPNDSSYSNGTLWGLNSSQDNDIDAPEAWTIRNDASSIVVGVIDSGIDTGHPELAQNIWRNTGEIAGNGIDDDGDGYVDDVNGYDFANNDGNPYDDNSHGTHCSGTIGGIGNNGQGIVGVAWRVQLMGLKFLGANGQGATSGAINAVLYAVTQKQRGVPVRVLSNSWGGGGYSQALSDAIALANQNNILFVAAAGNNGTNNDTTPTYPANISQPNVLTVAASDINGNRASFSNYGATTVHVAAPGVNIYSSVPGASYASYNGTSMATPHVSGIAALVYAQFPNARAIDVKSLIISSVKKRSQWNSLVSSAGITSALGSVSGNLYQPPVFTTIGDRTLSYRASSLAISLSATSATNQNITFSASFQNGDFNLNSLDQTYNFRRSSAANDNYNIWGYGERWIYCTVGGLDSWCAVLPSGAVYVLTGSNYLSPIANVGSQWATNIPEIVSPTPYRNNPPSVSLTGNNLYIQFSNPVIGETFIFTASADDGISAVNQTFRVTVRNQSPILGAISDVTMTRSQLTKQITIPITDADNDALTITAQIGDPGLVAKSDYNLTYRGFYNQRGVQEQYYQDPSGNWFLMFPNGDLKRWSGDLATSQTVTNLPVEYYKNPYNLEKPLLSSVRSAAYAVEQANGPFTYQAFPNYRGFNENYYTNPNGLWFYIRAVNNACRVFSWAGTIQASSEIGVIDSSYCQNPLLFANIPKPIDTSILNLSISGKNLTINPRSDFLGSIDVSISGSDGQNSVSGKFKVSRSNSAPVIATIANQSVRPNSGPATVSLSASDSDGDPITYSAAIVDDIVKPILDSEGPFSNNNGNYFTNQRGLQEKYISADNGVRWYYLTPFNSKTCKLFKWDGSLSTSPLLATLPIAYYNDPTLLNSPGSSSNVTLSISSSQLTLTPAPGFFGQLMIRVNATDGSDSDYTFFSFAIVNSYAPVIAPISDKTVSYKQTSLNVGISASDLDGDSISLSVSASELAPILYKQYQFSYPGDWYFNYRGASEKYLTGPQGTWYYLVPEGSAAALYLWGGTIQSSTRLLGVPKAYLDNPWLLINPIGDRTAAYNFDQTYHFSDPGNNFYKNHRGWNEVYLTGKSNGQDIWFHILPNGALYRWNSTNTSYTQIGTIDPAYNSSPTALIKVDPPTQAISASISGNSLLLSWAAGISGTYYIKVTASDGSRTGEQVFALNISSSSPIITPITDKSVVNNSSLNVALQATDPDGDSINWSAKVCNDLEDLDATYSFVTPANYYTNQRGANEKYFQDTNENWYYILPSGDVYKWGLSLAASTKIATVSSQVYTNPQLLTAATGGNSGSVSINGSTLTYVPGSNYTGDVRITVTATDSGGSTSSASFIVTVSNSSSGLIGIPSEPSPGNGGSNTQPGSDNPNQSNQIGEYTLIEILDATMKNTLSLKSAGDSQDIKSAKVVLRGQKGQILHVQNFYVTNSLNVTLNSLPHYPSSGYFAVTVEGEVQASTNIQKGSLEYSTICRKAQRGDLRGTVPLLDTDQHSELRIVNASNSAESANLKIFANDGTLVRNDKISIAPASIYITTIDSGSIELLGDAFIHGEVHTFGKRSKTRRAVGQSDDFGFASQLESTSTQSVPVSRVAGESAAILISGSVNQDVSGNLLFFDEGNNEISQQRITLSAHETRLVNIDLYFAMGTTGSVRFTPDQNDSAQLSSVMIAKNVGGEVLTALQLGGAVSTDWLDSWLAQISDANLVGDRLTASFKTVRSGKKVAYELRATFLAEDGTPYAQQGLTIYLVNRGKLTRVVSGRTSSKGLLAAKLTKKGQYSVRDSSGKVSANLNIK